MSLSEKKSNGITLTPKADRSVGDPPPPLRPLGTVTKLLLLFPSYRDAAPKRNRASQGG